jgi:hypothetical protein
MLVKIIIIFLLAMVLVGMIGKLLFPSAMSGRKRLQDPRKPPVCKHCGRYVIGTSCDCTKKG